MLSTVVVTAVKVAWKFEVTRRQNDKRVQMVTVKMHEMLKIMLKYVLFSHYTEQVR